VGFLYRIGEFSKMSKTTIKTLRYYDEIGLLKPEETDKFTSYRLYTTGQLFKLHKIQSYRQIGLSIEEVKMLLAGKNTEQILNNRKEEIISEINNAKDRLSRIEFILQKQEEIFMSYSAIIKEVPEYLVYSVEFTAPDYDSFLETIPAIGARLEEKYPDLKCSVPEYCIIRYLDGEYKDKDIRVELCEAVEQQKSDFDDVVFKHLDAVKVVSVMLKGPYSRLGEAYAFAMKWVEENGYVVSEAPRESYIDGIWNKESEEEWLTEIQIPVFHSLR
jgi:DNA-binding transcriptional MerR regulator